MVLVLFHEQSDDFPVFINPEAVSMIVSLVGDNDQLKGSCIYLKFNEVSRKVKELPEIAAQKICQALGDELTYTKQDVKDLAQEELEKLLLSIRSGKHQ